MTNIGIHGKRIKSSKAVTSTVVKKYYESKTSTASKPATLYDKEDSVTLTISERTATDVPFAAINSNYRLEHILIIKEIVCDEQDIIEIKDSDGKIFADENNVELITLDTNMIPIYKEYAQGTSLIYNYSGANSTGKIKIVVRTRKCD